MSTRVKMMITHTMDKTFWTYSTIIFFSNISSFLLKFSLLNVVFPVCANFDHLCQQLSETLFTGLNKNKNEEVQKTAEQIIRINTLFNM